MPRWFSNLLWFLVVDPALVGVIAGFSMLYVSGGVLLYVIYCVMVAMCFNLTYLSLPICELGLLQFRYMFWVSSCSSVILVRLTVFWCSGRFAGWLVLDMLCQVLLYSGHVWFPDCGFPV